MINPNDINEFFIEDDWCENVLYNGKKCLVIFDNESSPVNFGEIQMQSTQPRITAKESDFPNAKNGEVIILREKNWYIIDVQPGGTGIIEIMLSKKAPQK